MLQSSLSVSSGFCVTLTLCRLSGHVHAGCTGDHSAVISALELRGAQLVIANSTSLGAARVSLIGADSSSLSSWRGGKPSVRQHMLGSKEMPQA